MKETLSIIIPNTNSLLIDKILLRLKKQTIGLSGVEILVIGEDRPNRVVARNGVRFVPTDSRAAYAAFKRNKGMHLAKGNIYLFLDDDCLPAPDCIQHHLKRHRLGEKIVGGAVKFDRKHYFQLADNVSAFHDLMPFTPEGERPYLATANLSVRRDVVEKAGLMKTRLKRAEDLEWTVRFRTKGYRLFFEPRAIVFHRPDRKTLSRIWRHWIDDAPDTLRVRLSYDKWLETPFLARYRFMYLWGAPLVAAWATLRTFRHHQVLHAYWQTVPAVYLTKMIWCWGAFLYFPKRSCSRL